MANITGTSTFADAALNQGKGEQAVLMVQDAINQYMQSCIDQGVGLEILPAQQIKVVPSQDLSYREPGFKDYSTERVYDLRRQSRREGSYGPGAIGLSVAIEHNPVTDRFGRQKVYIVPKHGSRLNGYIDQPYEAAAKSNGSGLGDKELKKEYDISDGLNSLLQDLGTFLKSRIALGVTPYEPPSATQPTETCDASGAVS